MAETRAALTGGCQCGAVRYRLNGAPDRAAVCHCRMCQKAGGGPFMAFAAGPGSNFVVTRGKLASFASSDIAERGFCAQCGTPLTYRTLANSRVSVTMGSLDDPNAVEPNLQIGVESRVEWLGRALGLADTRTDQWLARRNIVAVQSRQHPDHD